MPAASSPYSPNDYSAIKYRGYQLPGNEIFKAAVAQDEFWKVGALRVKQVYDNALNLKLTNATNREMRDQFMQDADKEMVKLSSMNVAETSVQRQGFNIFKPLLKDEGIVSDDAATRQIESTQGDIAEFREKENGKYYSANNAMYALDGVHEFRTSKDRMAGKTYLQNAKSYEPYYDFSGEMNTILKNCKPEEYSRDVESGMNIVNYSSKALSSVRLSGCISSGLSDKAKRQLSIDGYVTYKNNPHALRDAYLPIIDASKSQLEEQNAAYSGILANKDKLSSLSEEQLKKLGLTKETVKQLTPKMIESFNSKLKDNQLRIDNFSKTINQLHGGDFSSIMGDNLEPVASMVYSKGYADDYGSSFSYDTPPSIKIRGNASQMLIYKENRQDLRQDDQQDFQLQLKEMDIEADRQLQLLKNQAIKGKGKNGELTALDIVNATALKPAFGNDVSISGDYDKLTSQRNSLTAEKSSLDDYFTSQLRRMGMDATVSDEDVKSKNSKFQNWYNNYTKTLPKTDPNWSIIKDYETKLNKVQIQQDLIKNNQDQIDNEIRKYNPGLFKDDMSNLKPVLAGRSLVTGDDVINAMKGNPSKLRIVNEPTTINSVSPTTGISMGGSSYNATYYLDGKLLSGADAARVHDLVSSVNKKNADRMNSLSIKRNDLARTKTIVQKEGYSFPELNDKENPLKLRILQSVGVNETDAITIGQTDLRGNVEVFLHADNSSNPKFDASFVADEFKRKYGDNLTLIDNDKYHFIVGGFNEVNKFNSPETQTSELMLPYVRSMEKNVTNRNSQTTGLLRSVRPDKSYGMEIMTSSSPGSYQYKVYDEDNNVLGIYNDRIAALQIMNTALEGRFNENKVK